MAESPFSPTFPRNSHGGEGCGSLPEPGKGLIAGRRGRGRRPPAINRPGLPGYLTIKPLYQKFFGGNWGGVAYTLACQSSSV
jgi:hypothetical protein